MKAVNTVVDTLCKLIMGCSALIVFVITFVQVLCRFVFKSPLAWSTDILRLAFTYMVFWGAAWCVKEKGHLNVDVVLTSFPKQIRKTVELLINCILLVLFIFLIVQGGKFAQSGFSQTTSYLPVPMTFYYLSIPTAAVVMVFYMVQIIFQQVKEFNNKEEHEA